MSKILQCMTFLLITCVSFSTYAGDFYLAVSASSNSIDDQIATQSYLPTASLIGTPTVGGVPPTLIGFDDISGFISDMQNSVPFIAVPSNVAADNDQTGYELSVGYHLLENFDLEISYADLGTYSTSPLPVTGSGISLGFSTDNFAFITPELEVEQFAIRARYRHEFSNKFSLLGSAGVINTSVDADFSLSGLTLPVLPEGQSLFANSGGSTEGTGAQLGAGVGWKLPQGFNVNLSYFRHFADTADLDSILLTLEYDL